MKYVILVHVLLFFFMLKETEGQHLWTFRLFDFNFVNGQVNYGTKNVLNKQVFPGGRSSSYLWIGSDNKTYHFGGESRDKAFSDVFKINDDTPPLSAWVLGPNVADTLPVYEEKGVPSQTANIGVRSKPSIWLDNDRVVWVMGGQAQNSSNFDDMWTINVEKNSTITWTWVDGSQFMDNSGNDTDTECTERPTARHGGSTWVDSNGILWLFGGAISNDGKYLNDLWNFDKQTKCWKLVGNGPNVMNSTSTTWPFGRKESHTWYHNNKLYMFAGEYTNGNCSNDLWSYDIISKQWRKYGGQIPLEQGFVSNTYGARGEWSSSWPIGSRCASIAHFYNGNLILFGGKSVGSDNQYGYMSDIWLYNVEKNQWAFMSGETNRYINASIDLPTNITSVPYPRAYCPSAIKGNMISFYGGKLVTDTGDVKAFGDMWNLNIDFLYTLIKIENTDPSETVIESSEKDDNSVTIIVSVVVPIVVIAIIIVAAILFRKKQKQMQRDIEKNYNEVQMEKQKRKQEKDKAQNLQKLESHMVTNVVVKEKIGEGNFGDVYSGTWNVATKVALKKLKSEEDIKNFVSEAIILIHLQHPNIVQYFGIYSEVNSANKYIVMELMTLGNLRSLMSDQSDKMDQEQLAYITKDIIAGLQYLHSKNIVHRDISLRNILVSESTGSRKFTVKISDFGMSKVLDDNYYENDSNQFPFKWAAVEVLRFNKFSSASDIWAYGVTIWELYSMGEIPYAGMSNAETSEQVTNGYRLPQPKKCPDELYKMMRECWKEKPADRPNSKEVSNIVNRYVARYEPIIEEEKPEQNVSSREQVDMYAFSDEKERNTDGYITKNDITASQKLAVSKTHYTTNELTVKSSDYETLDRSEDKSTYTELNENKSINDDVYQVLDMKETQILIAEDAKKPIEEIIENEYEVLNLNDGKYTSL